jgi:rod shape-determining protein MreC
MRNLLNFLLRFNHLIIFLLLEGVSFYYLATRNSYHHTRMMFAVRGLTQGIESKIVNVKSFIDLKDLNRSLSEENITLRNEIERLKKPGDQGFSEVSDSVYRQKYVHTPAEVIDNTINRQKNFFTINKGLAHGITTDMAVISPDGIAGVIIACSENFSVAMSALNLDFKVSARLKPTDYFGSLNWDGRNYRYAMLNEVPQHVVVNVGDTVETTGYSATFPEGVPVGVVSAFEKRGGDFYRITVQLATDFKKLRYVNVVGNIMKTEQLEIQNRYQ